MGDCHWGRGIGAEGGLMGMEVVVGMAVGMADVEIAVEQVVTGM